MFVQTYANTGEAARDFCQVLPISFNLGLVILYKDHVDILQLEKSYHMLKESALGTAVICDDDDGKKKSLHSA